MSGIGTMFISTTQCDPWFLLYLNKCFVNRYNENVYLTINYDYDSKKFVFGKHIIPKFYDTNNYVVLHV